MVGPWVHNDDNWDNMNGGALAFRYDNGLDEFFEVAGVTWLDGDDDGKHYFACIAFFNKYDSFGNILVECGWDALDAYLGITDSNVVCELGWYHTIDDARTAVEHVLELMK